MPSRREIEEALRRPGADPETVRRQLARRRPPQPQTNTAPQKASPRVVRAAKSNLYARPIISPARNFDLEIEPRPIESPAQVPVKNVRTWHHLAACAGAVLAFGSIAAVILGISHG